MAFILICGSTEFTSALKGYEGITAQCHNCGNWAAHCITRWPWFTVCWVPVLPLGGKRKEVACHICHFAQDVRMRPDVESQHSGGAPPPQQGMMGGPYGGGPPPPQQQQQQYK